MIHALLGIALGALVSLIVVIMAALCGFVIFGIAAVVRGFRRGAAAAKQEGEEMQLSDALSVILAHGDTMHTCPECESTQTSIEKLGYRYAPETEGMAIIVRERCNECQNEVVYLMTSIGWICAAMHTEWGMWMLAQDSSNLHSDITQDLSQLDDESGLDGPPVGG